MSDDRLSFRDAVRFTWHSLIHRAHAHDVWFDHRTDLVRCNRCGKTWGAK